MQIVSIGDDLHDMSNPIFRKKKKKKKEKYTITSSFADLAKDVVKIKGRW